VSLLGLGRIPRFPLCTLPTPLYRAERLERALGARSPRIWIKRDDLTGLAFGGNKARKLEYLIAAALGSGADVVVTEGSAQSNHARMTAAAAAVAGLDSILVLDDRRGAEIEGNLLLDHLYGAEVRIVPGRDRRSAAMTTIEAELVNAGRKPYMIATGGSTPTGALGYVRAFVELVGQLIEVGEDPRRLYFPTSSQGTLAGLAIGALLHGLSDLVYAIAVEEDSLTLRTDALPIAIGAGELLRVQPGLGVDDLTVDDRYIGEGYGIPSTEGMEAIALLATTEAIVLDPVYSGKAMASLIDHIRQGAFSPDDAVVFLHTGGGPSIFGSASGVLAMVSST
jgi:D-cysteine desulfhydrase family pyridoxal phosphate-dependent enzyme